MSSESEQLKRTNKSVLVAASLTAGAIGGTLALAQSNRKHSSSAESRASMRHDVDQTVDRPKEDTSHILDVAKDQAPIEAKSAQDQAVVKLSTLLDQTEHTRKNAIRSSGKRGVNVTAAGSVNTQNAAAQVNETHADVSTQGEQKGKNMVEGINVSDESKGTFSQSGRELGQRLRERLPEAQSAVHAQLAPRIADFRQQAESTLAGANGLRLPHATDIAPRLKDLGKQAGSFAATAAVTAAETGREHAPELKALLEDHVVPRLQDARQRAASLASDALEAGAERSNQTSGGGMPDFRHSADDLQKRFSESLGAAERSITDIRGNASHAVDTVGAQARVVGKNAGDGSKNAAAAVLWSGVAVGVVYVGLLKPQQREMVKQKANGAFRRAKETYADIRGRDGDFASDSEDAQ
jgi:hypothetical protein